MGSPPEDEDFRQALQGVEPLPRSRRAVLRRARPAPFPRQTRLDERAALAESLTGPLSLDDAIESGEELAFLRDGLSRDVLRKLRRGHWVVEDHLDLHGMNRLEAAVSVGDAAEMAASAGGAAGLQPSPTAHGGSGAVLLLLRSAR